MMMNKKNKKGNGDDDDDDADDDDACQPFTPKPECIEHINLNGIIARLDI